MIPDLSNLESLAMTGSYIHVPAPSGAFDAYFVPSIDGRGPGIVLC